MNWKSATLGQICKMYQPKTLSAKEMKSNGAYAVYGANGIIGNHDQYNHEASQLLVTCRGATCGAVNVSKPFSWINGNAMVVQPDTAKVSLRYMEYICRGGIDLSAAITGAAQPQIIRKSLEPIPFFYPSLAEQSRIVAKLDTALASIAQALAVTEARREQVEALKAALLSTSYDDLCGPAKSVRLGQVCDILSGGTPKSKEPTYWGGDLPWLTPKDMGQLQGPFVSKTARQISNKGLVNSTAKCLPAHSIILSSRAPIGYVAVNQVPMSFNQGCKGLVPRDNILVEYLYYFLLSSRQRLNDLGTGTTFKEITGKTLADVDLPLPAITEQKRIVAKLGAAFAQIQVALDAISSVRQNYQALQSALMAQALQPRDAA